MNDLIIYLNLLSIYSRLCHNIVKGNTFFQEHEFFTEVYKYSDSVYDSVVERCIGLDIQIDIQKINLKAATLSSSINIGKTNEDMYKGLLEIFDTIVSHITKIVKYGSLSLGVEQLIGDIANKLEMYQYKVKQILK